MTKTTIPSQIVCPKCGSGMSLKSGRFGEFYGCDNYIRGCRGTRPIPKKPKVVIEHKSVIGSPEQNEIWESVVNDDSHIVVNALAGTGKSFTCREAMHRLPKNLKILYLAFNKNIVREFKDSAPENATVCTLNSIGFKICLGAFKPILDEDKIENIVSNLYNPTTDVELKQFPMIVNAVEKIVSLLQGYLISPENREAILEVVNKHDVEISSDIEDRVFDLIPQVMRESANMTSVVNFNDQLWFPVIKNLPCPKYDVIFVDEAQDLNPLQHQLVLKLLSTNGRCIVVGDNNQAIYGFRGSDVDSIANFTKLLEETKEVKHLSLTVTRRCAVNIVNEAQKYVPEIQALPNANTGEVVNINSDQIADMAIPGDMILCRVNAPLVTIAYKFIKRGIKAIIRGRDIGKGLIYLIKSLNAKSMVELQDKLTEWEMKETTKYAKARRANVIIQQIKDRVECIMAFISVSDSISELISQINSLFSNFDESGIPKSSIILSSIHRAKGLESDSVYWYNPNLEINTTQDWQEKQEINLKYVATTRAKNKLVYVREGKNE